MCIYIYNYIYCIYIYIIIYTVYIYICNVMVNQRSMGILHDPRVGGYSIIFQAIFSGEIPLHRPYIWDSWTEQWKPNPKLSVHRKSWWVFVGIPRSYNHHHPQNIRGSIIDYHHRPTELLNTAQLLTQLN